MKKHLYLYFLMLLFFGSGCAALMYQVVWQRMLFTVFGIDIESTTIIVSVFMLGLGIGGLIGGKLSDIFVNNRILLFVSTELIIGGYGFLSPNIIGYFSNLAFDSKILTALFSYIVLLLPTVMMGMTLPILVTYINTTLQNIGQSVGMLYFINTLGAAAGAYLSGFKLILLTDLIGIINVAVFLNIIIALTALFVFKRR